MIYHLCLDNDLYIVIDEMFINTVIDGDFFLRILLFFNVF